MTAENPAAPVPAETPESEPANIAGGLLMTGPGAPDIVAPSDDTALPTAAEPPSAVSPDAPTVPAGRPPGAVSAVEYFGGAQGIIDIPERPADRPDVPPVLKTGTVADEYDTLRRRVAEAEAETARTRAELERAALDAVQRPPVALAPAPVPTLPDAASGNGTPPELELRPSGVIRLYLAGIVYTLRRPYVGEVEDFYIAAEEIGQATEALGRELEEWTANELARARAAGDADEVFVRGVPPTSALKIRVSALRTNRQWMEHIIGRLTDKPLPPPEEAGRPAWFGSNAVIRDMSDHWMANPLDPGQ